jgi:hypothetical protein
MAAKPNPEMLLSQEAFYRFFNILPRNLLKLEVIDAVGGDRFRLSQTCANLSFRYRPCNGNSEREAYLQF